MAVFRLSRRRLLVGAAGAATIAGASGLWLGITNLTDRRYRRSVDRDSAFAPNVFLSIEADGAVVIWVTRSEMGQGVSTALPMLVAEELDAAWSQVRVEQAAAEAHYDYGRLFTAASASVSSLWTELRRAGAVARLMLVDAAARRWGVSASDCTTRDGKVTHVPSGRILGYGELTGEAARSRLPLRVPLKSPAEFRLIGRPLARIDGLDRVTGRARYGLDVRLPEMRYAVLARPPVFGAALERIDDAAARAVDGVQRVVVMDNAVAVVARGSYAALTGRAALKLDWRLPPGPLLDEDGVRHALADALNTLPPGIAVNQGDIEAAFANAARTLSAEFSTDYVAHACMEPMNCTAWVTPDRCEIWAPTQDPDGAREVAAALTGLDRDRVVVRVTQLGGGFGRRTSQDFVVEAVQLARQVPGPVQLFWSREDDLRHGEHRPASLHRLEAALDASGRLTGWRHRLATAKSGAFEPGRVDMGDVLGAGDLDYGRIDAVRAEWVGASLPVPTRIWRAVGHGFNTFATEVFMDEIAHTAGVDPMSFRAGMLNGSPRLAACLDQVRSASRWMEATEDRWLGVACGRCIGSYAALVVELRASPDSRLVHAIWCAVDCGMVVNPDIARAQLEGGILFGLSAAVRERLTISEGSIREGNFDQYALLRLNEAPVVEIFLMPSNEYPSGLGEVGVPLVAPALANALFKKDGNRRRALPLATGTA